ncbi:MAG: class I SAM-dependent methyltransferase [Christensenellaceae bacterium]|jgi:SAM-dependent methyltransferase
MKQNKYDDNTFFEKYSQMERSQKGLSGAGEWHALKQILPNFQNKRVLDLGCGFGWHCAYAMQAGALDVTGVDISEKMLERAKKETDPRIHYIKKPIEEVSFPENSFDVVLSSLAFHYVADFESVVQNVKKMLSEEGVFVFSVEHPIFTAEGKQDWYYAETGEIAHWPVDNYFLEGIREAVFLGEPVTKYHRTLTTYLQTLLANGFVLTNVIEPMPEKEMMDIPGMKEELRRPMMLLVGAKKKV